MLNLPKTTREQIIHMREQGSNSNWVRSLAVESGVDFDSDTADQYRNEFSSKEDEDKFNEVIK